MPFQLQSYLPLARLWWPGVDRISQRRLTGIQRARRRLHLLVQRTSHRPPPGTPRPQLKPRRQQPNRLPRPRRQPQPRHRRRSRLDTVRIRCQFRNKTSLDITSRTNNSPRSKPARNSPRPRKPVPFAIANRATTTVLVRVNTAGLGSSIPGCGRAMAGDSSPSRHRRRQRSRRTTSRGASSRRLAGVPGAHERRTVGSSLKRRPARAWCAASPCVNAGPTRYGETSVNGTIRPADVVAQFRFRAVQLPEV